MNGCPYTAAQDERLDEVRDVTGDIVGWLVDDDLLAHGARAEHRVVAPGDPRRFAEMAARFPGPRVPLQDVGLVRVSSAPDGRPGSD